MDMKDMFMDKEIGKTSGVLIDIKRFAVHDGPGIRTTFFLKGCTLRCRWCHNPEGIAPQPELAFYAHKCRNCGYCAETCPHGAHTIRDGVHRFDRSKCRACGECEKWCSASALKLYGQRTTVDEALAVALEDRAFYEGSGGGVTLSGGEPLAQLEFTTALLAKLKSSGIHTALDTCLAVPRERVEAVMKLADMFLVDFKHADPAAHKQLTGRSNEDIRANLQYLSDAGARIEIRIPLVPTCNDSIENLEATGESLGKLDIESVRLLAYHAQAATKYTALGEVYTMPEVTPPDAAALRSAAAILRKHGLVVHHVYEDEKP